MSPVWSPATPLSAPQANMSTAVSMDPQQISAVPPPAHVHPTSTNLKPPDSFLDKSLLETAAFLDGKSMSLPVKTSDSNTGVDSQSSIPWAIEQQYGQFMLEKMFSKPDTSTTSLPLMQVFGFQVLKTMGHLTPVENSQMVTNDLPQSLITTSTRSQSATSKAETCSDLNSIEAQWDVYGRMLNYCMSSTLAQQYYLSQYGYNYSQDRSLFSKADSGSSTATATTASASQAQHAVQASTQLPSIDSVLLNLSTKKNGKASASTTLGTHSLHTTTVVPQNVQTYGFQIKKVI